MLIDYNKPEADLPPSKSAIPLKKVNAKVQIYGGVAKLDLEHEYTNTSKDVLETKFTFPVDPDMAVCSLTIVTEEKELQAKIMKKEKAEEKYDDAISSGDAAYMLQYDKDTQDLLTMKIGALLPEKSVTVKLGVVIKLEVVDKSYALLLSPTFTPRYVNRALMNEDEEVPAGASTTAVKSEKLPYKWEVEVDIAATGPI